MKKTSINTYIYIAFAFSISTLKAQEVLTQKKAVVIALESNYGIKMVNNNVAVAKNNSDILNSGYLPTLTGNAGANTNLNDTEAVFSNGDVTNLEGAKSSSYNASLNLNYTLFDGLGREYNYKKLQEEYKLSELQARETIENTILQLFSLYYNVALLKENTSTLTQSFEISKERTKRSDYQFEYGQNTKLEVLNAQVDVNNDSIQLMQIDQQLSNAKRNLNVILGNTLRTNYDVNTQVDFSLQLKKESLFTQAKDRNIALLKADKNIAIKKLEAKIIKSDFLPTLGLTGSYGWSKNNNNAASFLTTSTNTGLSGGLSLSWNLFDGKNYSAAKNTKLAVENEKLSKQNILIEIERDFNNAWEDYQNKYKIYQVQELNIKTAQNNFDRTQEKFKLGQINSIDFRQAQLNLLNVQLNKSQAKYEAKLAELQLLFLSGDLLNQQF
ncbi:outer membrane protein TolC [Wenyingzhuangia heitensis]|uniref:Outer membrane protein TolC n=1 Tax=Wenyingzhuangia heitensis TaxID=1487859 RepID=A0ABX0UBY3_9FLAO|nr:TolC family protein [Wenyingzhuangia heitensis]NIJ46339.1 outer membrane protein TolC [Wenyingzhuangia heitensis]